MSARTDTTSNDQRDRYFSCCNSCLHKGANQVHTWMATTFCTYDGNCIDTDGLSFKSEADGGYLVQYLDTCSMKSRKIFIGISTSRFYKSYSFLNEEAKDTLGLILFFQYWQHRYIDTELLSIYKVAAATNFIPQII